MKIISKKFSLKIIENPSSKYFEKFFQDKNLNVVRWMIVSVEQGHYLIDISFIETQYKSQNLKT